MLTQTIDIGPCGEMTSLQFKGRGVDLREFGKAEIVRSSLIEWDSDRQAWYVKFLRGRMADQCLLVGDFHTLKLPTRLMCNAGEPPQNKAYFLEYEEAVFAEVEAIQKMREKFGVDYV